MIFFMNQRPIRAFYFFIAIIPSGFFSGILLPSKAFSAPIDWMAEGNLAYRQGNYETAEMDFYQACRENLTNAQAFCGVGLCEYRMGRLDSSRTFLSRALALAFTSDHGLIQRFLQQVEAAIRAKWEKRVWVHLLMQQGVAAFRAKQYDAARVFFQNAVYADPSSSEARFNLALAYLKTQDWQDCYEELQKCLSLDPDHKGAHYAMGVLYQKTGNASLAQSSFQWLAGQADSGGYGPNALGRLSQLQAVMSTPSLWHFYSRLAGGYTQESQYQYSSPVLGAPLFGQYLQALVGCTPHLSDLSPQFSYGLTAYQSEQSGTVSDNFYNNLSVGGRIPAAVDFQAPFSFEEALQLNQDSEVNYRHDLATVGLQYFFKEPDFIQIQGQWLNETYPLYSGYDATSWIGSLSAWHYFPGGHALSLTYTFRADTAAVTNYSYLIQNLGALYYYGGGNQWGVMATAYGQWQYYLSYTDGNSRCDWSENLLVEVTFPLMAHWNIGIGDQFQIAESTLISDSQLSNNAYFLTTLIY